MLNTLKRWRQKQSERNRNRKREQTRKVRLAMETLEDRAVPAVWTWGSTLYMKAGNPDLETRGSITEYDDGRIGVSFGSISGYGGSFGFTIYDAGEINSIYFDGGNKGDHFENNSSIRCNAYGRGGNDTLIGGSANDNLFGESGSDSLIGGSGRDILRGGTNNDTLRGGRSNDTLYGGAGTDRLYGDEHRDTLYGHEGSVYGGTEKDYLYGGSGSDILYGEGGGDRLYGNDHNDTMYGGPGNDSLYGHDGDDSLLGEDGQDKLYGYDDDDVLRGGNDNDSLYGYGGDDSLFGGEGRDSLSGSSGDDMLFGGVMDDFHPVIGSGDFYTDGQDTLYGSSGADRLLVDVTDYIKYPSSEDAKIVFAHGEDRTIEGTFYGDATWTDSEVERIDWVFSTLQDATDNTKLLKQANGDSMVFYRHDGNGRGWNFGHGDEIILTDAQLDDTENWLRGYVLHEIGHNWNGHYIGTSRWADFLNLSGWRGVKGGSWTFNVSADFASGYAQTNPNEDWAESFAAYFLDVGGESWYNDGSGASAIPDKIDLIDNWVDSL